MFIANLIVVVFAGTIASFYVNDANVVEITKLMVYAFSLGQLLCVIDYSIIQTYQSQNFKIVFVFSLLSCLIIPVVTALLLIPSCGLLGVFITLFSGETFSLILIFIYSCYKTKSLSFNMKNVLTLGNNFEIEESDLYEACIVNIKQLSNIVDDLTQFYERKNFAKRDVNVLTLCIEEFIVDRFTSNKQKATIDMRVISHDNENYIRFRDNCKNSTLFDFFEGKAQKHHEGNNKIPLGYQIINNFSSKIQYKQIFKMNTTIIDIIMNKQ